LPRAARARRAAARLGCVRFARLGCARSVFRENKKARTVGARFCESPMG